ncbi:MAG: low molecular weight protein-tyrosine-phosphatase, partial [Phycisphaerales bacterium JB059]
AGRAGGRRVSRTGVLFVCLGNICRSPLGEGIFLHMARQRGALDRFDVDSCGTGAWHAGERADPRSIAIAKKYGIELPSIARQFDPRADVERFDLILAMDRQNERDLLGAGAPEDRVRLMRSFDPTLDGASGKALDVPDPYYGRGDGFQRVYDMLTRACAGLLDELG